MSFGDCFLPFPSELKLSDRGYLQIVRSQSDRGYLQIVRSQSDRGYLQIVRSPRRDSSTCSS
jgi:hypothetical protein